MVHTCQTYHRTQIFFAISAEPIPLYKRNMASKDSDISICLERLNETINCSICAEVFKDPKILACIHTFCLTCLEKIGSESKKKPGDKMPCPLCRRDFSIPPEGLTGLHKNFFVERLIKIANSLRSVSGSILCDTCSEKKKSDVSTEIALAELFCGNCKVKLCKECSDKHRSSTLTEAHTLITLNELLTGKSSVIESLVPDICDLHDNEVLKYYCLHCKTVLCTVCFLEKHKGHDGSFVKKAGDEFRKQLQATVDSLLNNESEAQNRKANLEKENTSTLETISGVKERIIRRRDHLRKLADKNALDLLQALESLKKARFEEIQTAADNVNMHLTSLKTYISHCKNLITRGSSSDICRSINSLIDTKSSLQKENLEIVYAQIRAFTVFYCDTNLEVVFQNECSNIIGSLTEDDAMRTDTRGNVNRSMDFEQLVEQQREEIEKLRNKVQTLEGRLKGMSRKVNFVEMDYRSNPELVVMIQAKPAEGGPENTAICGLTVLGEELFIARCQSSIVEVYESLELSFRRRFELQELKDPSDMASSNRNKCLYILSGMQASQILRVDTDGKVLSSWSTKSDFPRLSVSGDSNVILAARYGEQITEYSPDGELIRQIKMSSASRFDNVLRAIKLINGRFLVSDGEDGDRIHRVCLLEVDGRIKKSYGGYMTEKLYVPIDMAVDGNGSILVANRDNNKILLLDSCMKYKREIVNGEKHGIKRPRRICLDETNGRLFVADESAEVFAFNVK